MLATKLGGQPAVDSSEGSSGLVAESGVTAAAKLRDARLPERLRVLVPADGSPMVVYHKDNFEYGGQAQLFAGLQAGRAVVVRRISALDVHRPEGLRGWLGAHRGRQDTQSPAAIARDVRVTGEVAAARGQPFAALFTTRGQAGGPAKVYEILPPRAGDLIEVVRALRCRSPEVKAAVAAVCVGRLARDAETLAAAGVVHRDLGPHNILVDMDADGRAVVEATDFGLVEEVAPGGPLPRRTLHDLGRILLTLLDPDALVDLGRGHRALDQVLAGARLAAPGLAALADDLLAGRVTSADRIEARLSALEVAPSLATPVLAAVRAKAGDIEPLLDAIRTTLAAAELGDLGAAPRVA